MAKMLSLVSAIMVLIFTETRGAHRPDMEINRLKLLTAEHTNYEYHGHYPAVHVKSNNVKSINSEPKSPLNIYQPKEDPRMFYQSDAYSKYNKAISEVNSEVSAIYPGKDVIRANERQNRRRFDRLRRREQETVNRGDPCIRCPRDRTLVAKGGSSKVLLQRPRLSSCSGRPAPRNVHFTHMYGPAFRTLLEEGSHTVVGRMTQGNTTLKHCKMQIDVILQTCRTPKYLESQCGDRHSHCNFTCRDKKMELQGPSSLLCGGDLKWSGSLPVCKAPSCAPLPPPPQSHVSCQGATVAQGRALAEGSRCRVRCPRGWRSTTRGEASVCRHGVWTKPLACLPKRNSPVAKIP